MAAHYFDTVEHSVTGKPVAGASVTVLDAADGAELTIYTDELLSEEASNPLTTDSTGFFEFYTDQDEGCLVIAYDGTTYRTIENVAFLGGAVSTDLTTLAARVDLHDTVLGLAASATSLGTFTGSTIADSSSVKTALQALETSLETDIAGLAAEVTASANAGAVGSSGLTMSTARILGRTTASTGAVEELTAANVRDFVMNEWLVPNFSDDGEVRYYADVAMTITEQATSGTGTVAYEKSTTAAPTVFSSTTSPISLQAGAWLKVSATSVTGLYAVALKRTA